ncbi:MAG: hypothetical protein NWR49_09190, partial [Crocinitomicaceae bacterium]|nr:hypothetical protein [Crocinitomicaceae bacterium]
MRRIALSVAFLGLFKQTAIAQVGIGTTTPDASAKLQIDAIDKGFLPPRVALTSLSDQSTIATPAEGLLVYCTGTAGLAEGYYYWEGSTWVKMSNTANTLDMGYVLAWPSNATPPDYLLPLSGGTYNWADYPEFQAFNGTYPSQFITASTATTFTLKNINGGGRFLRGGTTAGTDQDDATSLPTTAFTAATAGAHAHSVDPAAVNTNTTGGHQHSTDPAPFSSSINGEHSHGHNASGGSNAGLAYRNGYQTTTGYDNSSNELNEVYTLALQIYNSGSHDHTIDVPATTSSSNGDHTHSVDIPATTSTSNGDHSHAITGGDAETRPINI